MRKINALLVSLFVVILALSTLAGCEGLFGGNDQTDGIEGRYRFVSRIEYERTLKVDENHEIYYEMQLIKKYEIGDTVEEHGTTHTYSENSYILDVYENKTFFLTSYLESSEQILKPYKYTWHKEIEEVYWTDVNEWYYFASINLAASKLKEELLYRAYIEKDAIIFSTYYYNSDVNVIEIRLEKVEMSEDEKAQRNVVGCYHFNSVQAEYNGEEKLIKEGVPFEIGDGEYDVFSSDTCIAVLQSDGAAQLYSRVFGGGPFVTIKTGTWCIKNGQVIISCESADNFFGLKEVTLKVGKNTLTWTADGNINDEIASVVLTLKK